MIENLPMIEEVPDAGLPKRRSIVFVVDDFAVQLMDADNRFVKILLSNPTIVEVTGRTISKGLVTGTIYDKETGIFVPPQPHDSWTFDPEQEEWIPPVPHPEDKTKTWLWSESNQRWYDREELKDML
jgi:hypothetical protein